MTETETEREREREREREIDRDIREGSEGETGERGGETKRLTVCGPKCSQQRRRRRKTINMNSTLGNVGFLDNGGRSQTNVPFHNNTRQSQYPPLISIRVSAGRSLSFWAAGSGW